MIIELLEKYWRYIKLLSFPHYLATLAVLALIAWLRYDSINWWQNIVLAALISPISLGALLLLLVLWRYDFSARGQLEAEDEAGRRWKTYARAGTVSRIQNRLSDFGLGASVPLAYFVLSTVLALRTARTSINSKSSAQADRAREALIFHYDILHSLATFVSNAGAVEAERDRHFDKLLSTIATSARSSPELEGVLSATYRDGSGILSTLNGVLRSHVILLMPKRERDDIYNTLRALGPDKTVFGWLGGRVVQLALEAELKDDRALIESLRDWSAEAAARLTALQDDRKSQEEEKYVLRKWLVDRITSPI